MIGSTFAEDVCFDEIGCFTNDFPWSVTGSRPSRLPDSPDKIGTEFRLYATDSKKYEVLSLGSDEIFSSTFKKDADTIFLIHGWQSDGDQNWPMGAVDNFMDFYPEMNTITVDWRGGSKLLDYPQSASNTQVVGRQVAILARKLIESGLLESGANIKIAGHSLGGQIAGYAGKYFQTITGGEKLAQITGLDPAGPMFQLPDLIMNGPDINKIHIWKNDADFVDIIHTTAGYSLTNGNLGMATSVGHADFFPNGGNKDQPGCLQPACDHGRAHEYYVASIKRNCFQAFSCNSYDDFNGDCDKNVMNSNRMGFSATKPIVDKKYYLETIRRDPFCKI